MTRLHHVKKARKDYPDDDIKKGDSYYWWKFKYRPRRKSKTKPSRSQLTQSEFLSQIYDIEDTLNNISPNDDFDSVKSDIVDELESLKDETENKLDNMPYQLQDAEVGQLLRDRIEYIDEMIERLESIETTIDVEEIKNDTEREANDTDDEFNDRVEGYIEEKEQEIAEEFNDICYDGE